MASRTSTTTPASANPPPSSKKAKGSTPSPVASSIYQSVAKEEGEPLTGALAAIVKKRKQARKA